MGRLRDGTAELLRRLDRFIAHLVGILQDDPVDVATGEIVEERLASNAVDADMRHVLEVLEQATRPSPGGAAEV